jgi:radical SAM superfamily enzyme YgiQ (UPF0313 family)
MRILILGESCLMKLPLIDKTIFSTFSLVSSVYARQLATVTPKKHNTKLVESFEEIDFNNDCEVVHIHFKTAIANRAYEIADMFRNKGKTIILSGSHPSALPKEAKYHADSVIIGSAENLWPIVLQDIEMGKLKPFYRKTSGNNHQLPLSTHIVSPSGVKLITAIEATRGCPYKCDFCQESNVEFGSVFRTRNIKDIIKEIKLLPQKFLLFCDVSMTIDVAFTKALFKQMKGLKKKFLCEGNADALAQNDELLKLSRDAGCIEWTVGFESFAQQTLDGIHKKTNTVEDFSNVVKKIHKYDMAALGNFIFGFEQDRPDVFEFTQHCINDLGLDSARFAILTPYPGTPLFKKFKSEGRIFTYDWSKYNRKTVVFEPKNMSKDELQQGFHSVIKNFNSLHNIVIRNVRAINYGFYSFLATTARNLEMYMVQPKK